MKSKYQYVASDFLEEFRQNFSNKEIMEIRENSLLWLNFTDFNVPLFELTTV